MEDLTYEQTIELEENIKIKNHAQEIYSKFLKNIKLEVKYYKGDGKFIFWSDEHNHTSFEIVNDKFYFKCYFLHESYSVLVTPEGIFSALKKKYRGVEHLESAVRDRND